MAADSWLNKHGNTIRDVCYTSMSTASNIQEKYLHPQSAPCYSLPQFPAVPPHHTAKCKHVHTRDRSRHVPGIMVRDPGRCTCNTRAWDGRREGVRSFWSTLVKGSWPPTKCAVLLLCIQLQKVY